MNIRRLTNRIVACVAMALAASMVGGTIAFWTQELQTRNEFELGVYDTKIVEEFISPDNWQPGIEVNKDALIKNDGTVPVYVRVTLNQKWIRQENVYNAAGEIVPPAKDQPFPLTFDVGSDKEYAAKVKWGKDVMLLSTGEAPTPSMRLGLATATDASAAAGKWLLMSETPDSAGNYTFYYIGVLNAGKSTPLLVDGVEMNPAIQATTIAEHTVWDKANSKWVSTTDVNTTSSYENARYTLGVTMNTVQATKAALEEVFDADNTFEQAIISYLGNVGVTVSGTDKSRDDTVKQKLLYFEEVNGKMRYTPVSGTENWFMSHLNMLPGESYEDTLEIENRSKKTYDLYMQAIPLDQTKVKDELLEYIGMKVYLGTKLIYDGTAMGKAYNGSVNDLQKVIPLGTYKPDAKQKIRVELTLDKNIPMEYAGLLTQIDWKFMVEEKTTATPTSVKPNGPKTGDEQDNTRYIYFICIAGTAFTGCVVYLLIAGAKRKRESYFDHI